MGTFEYVMALVSIVVGLGLTHILKALGAAIHRLKKHDKPVRLEAVYLLWIAFVLIWLVSFWWWEFKFKTIDLQWTFESYLFVLFYAIVLFLTAVILVPNYMEGVKDSYEYFMSGRRWFFGMVILANFIDVGDSMLKGVAWALRPASIVNWVVFFAAGVIGIFAKRRSIQLSLAIVMFLFEIVFSLLSVDTLGAW